jgi:PKD repeat protein
MRGYNRFIAAALAACALMGGGTAVAQDDDFYLVLSNGAILSPDDKSVKQTLPNRAPDSVVQQGNLRFNVFYEDNAGIGFRDNNQGELRQTRYEEALAYVGQVLNISNARTLDVLVDESLNVNNGTLALGGTFFQGVDGYTSGIGFQRVFGDGAKPSATRPEIFLQVNFTAANPFHAGSGAPSNTQFDLQSVLLHEILHALGFISLAEPDGSSPFSTQTYTVFDRFIRRNTGNRLLFPLDGGVPIFDGTAADLISDNLGFTGPLAGAQFGSVPPLFAPTTFQNGSSISHWDTGNIPGGAVMEHAFAPGEIIRQFPAFEAISLRDIGWTQAATGSLQRAATADFSADETTVNAGANVKFTDLSASGSRAVTAWAWNFGDGTTSNQPNPTKAYAAAGSFNVSLTVTTGVGSDSETKNGFITVSAGPTANFTATPTSGEAPLNVQFTDTSNSNGGTINSRQWNFGDGGSSNAQNPSHTYNNEGTFTVTLTVTASNGTDTETKTGLITVAAAPEGGCGGGKSLDGKGIATGDALVSAASMGLLLLVGLRRKR